MKNSSRKNCSAGAASGAGLKIAMVSPYSWAHPGGVNNHISGLARQMVLRGHRVTVIAPDEGRLPAGVSFLSAGRSVPVPANGSVANLALFPGTVGRVAAQVRGGGYDVVHLHEPLIPLVSTAALRSAACRVAGTFHASHEGSYAPYGLARITHRRLSRRIDVRLAVSPAARELAFRYFPGEYLIVPNGVDLSCFSPGLPRPDFFPPPGVPVVLFVGRNEKRKGLQVLLQAFPAVRRRVPGCVLVVVGAGYEDGIGEAPPGIDSKAVISAGFVDNSRLPAVYGAADVFCAPSLGGESFGIILLEAMASGTPVVAADIQGYRGVVEQAGGGKLFPVGDPEALAGLLVEMLEDPGRRLTLSGRGLEGVKQFSWEVLASRLEAVYRGGTEGIRTNGEVR